MQAGIPVMGHVGLVPQSVNAMGGYVVQGKDDAGRERIIDDALALQEAGAYAVVLEGIPNALAEELTARLDIPTIGIGAGKTCDGQVLVIYDLLGLDPSFKPKFVKRYADGAATVTDACKAYIDEVRAGSFPDEEHSFGGGAVYGGVSAPESAESEGLKPGDRRPKGPGRLKVAVGGG